MLQHLKCLLHLLFPLSIHLVHLFHHLTHLWSAQHVDLVHVLGEETNHQVLPEIHRFGDVDVDVAVAVVEDMGEHEETGEGKDADEVKQHLD